MHPPCSNMAAVPRQLATVSRALGASHILLAQKDGKAIATAFGEHPKVLVESVNFNSTTCAYTYPRVFRSKFLVWLSFPMFANSEKPLRSKKSTVQGLACFSWLIRRAASRAAGSCARWLCSSIGHSAEIPKCRDVVEKDSALWKLRVWLHG